MNPERNQHAYKLEGFDKDWKYIAAHRFGQYSNLSPGKYTLHLKGSNNDGVWNEEGTSIKITIAPPFWKKWWFMGLGIIVFVGAICGIFQLRINSLKDRAVNERNHAIATTATQVAHDIRSPLAAMNIALKLLPAAVAERERVIIRNAAQRINDIANNLLLQYKIKGNENTGTSRTGECATPELISTLLDSLVSEKRLQSSEKGIELVLKTDNAAYGSFVKLEAGEFKRVISNLINNAFEAITGSNGAVRILLEKNPKSLAIKIIDNGKGIAPELLSKIEHGGISIGKRDGFGLGISAAIRNIQKWNGSYDIRSKIGSGTTFAIELPLTNAPDWFQEKIELKTGMSVVVLDDDQSIHDIWNARFQDIDKQIEPKHFYAPTDFIEYCQNSPSTDTLFLMDYEFFGHKDTNGLDLIEKLSLQKQALLVTSHCEDKKLRERMLHIAVKGIPKYFAPYIPISLSS